MTELEMEMESKPRIMKSSPLISWIGALACAAGGVTLCLGLPLWARFTGDGTTSPANRLVCQVGPLGWLLFSLLGAVLILCFRRSRLGLVLVIAFALALSAAIGALLLTSVVWESER